MADRSSGELSLRRAWRSLGLRLAVAAGSLAALLSLLSHVPVPIACLRGAAAWALVLVVSRIGLVALERALTLDLRPRGDRRPPR